MSVQQALTHGSAFGGGSGDHISFTSQFLQSDGSSNGSNPTAGSDLIVFVDRQIASSVDDVYASDGSSLVTQGVNDYNSFNTDEWQVWRIPNIGSGVTHVFIDLSGNAAYTVFCVEESESLTLEDTVAYGTSGEGFVTDHAFDFTSGSTDELGLLMINHIDTSGSGGSSVVEATVNTNRSLVYNDYTATGTQSVDHTRDAAGNSSGMVVSYSRAASGITIEVPNGPVW